MEEAQRLEKESAEDRRGGRYDEAIGKAQKALALRESHFGRDFSGLDFRHPDWDFVVKDLVSLAQLYADRGQDGAAEPYLMRAVMARACCP